MLSNTLMFASAVLSSLVLLVGLFCALWLSWKTSKSTVLWPLMVFFCFLLFLNQVAEVLELGSPEGGSIGASPMGGFGEDLEYTTLVASSAVLVAIALLIRRSLLLPV